MSPGDPRISTRWKQRVLGVLTGAVLVVGVVAHSRVYGRFLSDDALISFRYAKRFACGLGLTWTDGERVEGYSDFLWVLLIACANKLGFACIGSALRLDQVGVCIAVVLAGVSPKTGRFTIPRAALGGGLLAASAPMGVWANGGLEHGFMMGVLAVAWTWIERRIATGALRGGWFGGMALACLALLRVDGLVLVALLVVGAVIATGLRGDLSSVRPGPSAGAARWGPLVLPPAVAILGHVAFRAVYYRTLLPNTAVVKVAFTRDRLAAGLDYVHRGYHAIWILVALAIIATPLSPRPFAIPRWTVIVGWSAYVLAVGGDIFPGWRQLTFVFYPLALLAADLGDWLAWRFEKTTLRAGAAGVAFVVAPLLAAVHYKSQEFDPENVRARQEQWEREGRGVGILLKTAFGKGRPLLAVDAAGALPYWSELPSLDMLGLNDAHIAHHRSPRFGHGEIGHDLGDGAYVLARKPDLIAFNGATGDHRPMFLSGLELVSQPSFASDYEWIRVQASEGHRVYGEIWVRRDSEVVGIVRRSDRIVIPGYLLTGQESGASARLDGSGALCADVTQMEFGALPSFDVPAGRWRIRLGTCGEGGEGTDAAPRVGLRCGPNVAIPLRPSSPIVALDRPGSIGLAVAPPLDRPSMLAVRTVTLERTNDGEGAVACPESGQPVVLLREALADPDGEPLPASHPAGAVFGQDGIRIPMPASQRFSGVSVRLRNEAPVALALTRGGRTLWAATVGPSVPEDKSENRTIHVEQEVVLEAGDALRIAPAHGGRRFVLWGLRLVP